MVQEADVMTNGPGDDRRGLHSPERHAPVGGSCHHHDHGGDHHDHAVATEGVLDPVCGMTVDPHKTAHRHAHQGRTYYFCSAGCRSKFAADPAKYLKPEASSPTPEVPEGTIYTCPMHPEIRQVGPG